MHILNYLSMKNILLKLNWMVHFLVYCSAVKADGNVWSLLCCQGCKLCPILIKMLHIVSLEMPTETRFLYFKST